MSTTDRLSQLSRQTRMRVASADHLRAEHDVIRDQTARRLAESRALLDRSAVLVERRIEPSSSAENV